MTTYYLACDLGADSGRLILGQLEAGRLTLEELHRFANTPLKVNGALHWDSDRLFAELTTGLKIAAQRRLPYASISCDSWGVDYFLYDDAGRVIPPTFHYRDARTAAGVQAVRAKVDWPTVFGETGIQFMALNTIYQLAAETPARLDQADRLLCVGDGFNHFLSGVARTEESLASTTQLYNPRTHAWSQKLLDVLGLPARLFTAIVPSGTRLGPLTPALAAATGLPPLEVIASCSHDTGAAVAAVPMTGSRAAYLSSGTWSLMGIEREEPVLTDQCRELNFTNEIGYGGSIRLLKNLVGLWIVQECRRDWAKTGSALSFAELEHLAQAAPPFVSLINPNDDRFLRPDDMPAKVAAFCRETGQPVPETPGAIMRCVYESLALLYRRTLRQIETLTGQPIDRLHIVGGGSKDQVLNQFTANALQIPVETGPVEATAAGNLLVQALTLGHLPSLDAARAVVRASMPLKTFTPQAREIWETAAARFTTLLERPSA